VSDNRKWLLSGVIDEGNLALTEESCKRSAVSRDAGCAFTGWTAGI